MGTIVPIIVVGGHVFLALVVFAVRAVLAVESHCAHSGCCFRIFCYFVVVGFIPFSELRVGLRCAQGVLE